MTKREWQKWTVAACIFITLLFAFGAGQGADSVFFLSLLQHFGWSRTHLSWIFSWSMLASAAVAPLVGWLLDRLEARIVMATGVLVLALGLVAAGYSNNFEELFIAYLLVGVGMTASTMIPGSLVIVNWFGEERRGTALGIATAGQEAGGMVVAAAAAYAISWTGWRAAYLIVAAPLVILILPLIILLVRSRPEGSVKRSVAEAGEALDGFEIKEALKTRAFWMLIIINLTYPMAYGGTILHVVAYLAGIGYTERTAALMISVSYFFGALGKPLMGALADRIGGRYALGLGFLSMALGEAALIGAHQGWMLALFVVMAGSQMASGVGLVPMVLADTFGLKRFGALYGILIFSLLIGRFTGYPLIGRLFDTTGSYTLSFEVCTVIILIAAAAGFACAPPHRRPVVAVAASSSPA